MADADVRRPTINNAASRHLWTFQDAVEHLIDLFDGNRTPRERRMATRAVLNAYRDMPNKHRWTYFERLITMQTDASQDFTSSYDHSGGAYERVLTSTSGNWPSNAQLGWVIIGDDRYKVLRRRSNTEITLEPNSNPGEDVGSGTVTWHRAIYPLNIIVRRASPVVELSASWRLTYLAPAAAHQLEVGNYQPSRPYAYTFVGDDNFYGNIGIQFIPPPSEKRDYEFMAEVAPRALNTEIHEAGTVTTSSTTVTGSGTAFASQHVGSIIRFSANGTDAPTSVVGSMLPDGSSTYNPFTAQRVVTDVASATSLTIDTALTSNLTAVKYTISDPLDIESGSMFTYFQRLAELEFAIFMRNDNISQFIALEQQALRHAMGSDNRNKDLDSFQRPRFFYTLGDWAVIEQ